jgi:glucose-6-phosphate dehydrogenase assembly protein OpcA
MKPSIKPQPRPPAPVPLRDVERELSRRLKALQGPSESPIVRACMSNLVIFCDGVETAEKVSAKVPELVALHPARVLLLVAEPGQEPGGITSVVNVRGHVAEASRWVCCEEVTLHATGPAVDRLPAAVRALVVGDLPTNLWWAVPRPPPLAGELLFELIENVEQVIYDSIGWPEPAKGVVATASWLDRFEQPRGPGRWRVASDLNWRRLKYWRRLLTQALDPATAPGALESITEVSLEHGPHCVVQALELVSWLAAKLGWTVRQGKAQPGLEFSWQLTAGRRSVQVHIRRLEEGPPAIRRLRIAWGSGGAPGALNLEVAEGDRRLAAMPEKEGAAARTIAVPAMPLVDMLAKQLSDRERDPVFTQSMALAREMAQSILV